MWWHLSVLDVGYLHHKVTLSITRDCELDTLVNEPKSEDVQMICSVVRAP